MALYHINLCQNLTNWISTYWNHVSNTSVRFWYNLCSDSIQLYRPLKHNYLLRRLLRWRWIFHRSAELKTRFELWLNSGANTSLTTTVSLLSSVFVSGSNEWLNEYFMIWSFIGFKNVWSAGVPSYKKRTFTPLNIPEVGTGKNPFCWFFLFNNLFTTICFRAGNRLIGDDVVEYFF